MARNNDRDRDRGSKRMVKDTRPRGKKKVCIFCKDHVTWVDYKDVALLRRFMSDRGKIRSRRVTGNCAQHQRDVQVAIKTAREVALLPYTQRTVSERGPGRGPRGGRGDEGEGRVVPMDGATADTGGLEDEDLDGAEDTDATDDGDEETESETADAPPAPATAGVAEEVEA
jgi:small subunit ribosomal protein S18